MLENNAVKWRAFCIRKRVKYVTAHAQKFSDINLYTGTVVRTCILLIRTFHLSELFLGNLSNGVRITEDALYIHALINVTCAGTRLY